MRRRRADQSAPAERDLEIERLVAGQFHLDASDMHWVLGVLESAQALEPIRTLRVASADLIRPHRVAEGSR